MEKHKINKLKLIFSILIGLIIGVLSFFTSIGIIFSPERKILWTLLCIFFISVIVFLILWNKIISKKVYLLLSLPVLCIITGIIIIQYRLYIENIPAVEEENVYVWSHIPFNKNSFLARLDENSNLKITENMPILNGATALYPIYASFVEAVYPENKYDDFIEGLVRCSGTGSAYENLYSGAADMIFCAEPSESQLKMFADDNINLKMIPIGKDAFVFFVNKENPVNNLTIEDIKKIYSGKIKNWKKLNGKNQPIKIFQRPNNSGSQTALAKLMENTPIKKAKRENVSKGMGSIINQVAVYKNFPNAIGYSFLFFTVEMTKNNKIKLLSIEGIYPSRESIQDNSYPFSGSFYAIYIDDDKKNENIEPFINWILSNQGQSLISKTGYLPVKTGD